MSDLCSAHQGPCPDTCPIQYRATKVEVERLRAGIQSLIDAEHPHGDIRVRDLEALISASAPSATVCDGGGKLRDETGLYYGRCDGCPACDADLRAKPDRSKTDG